MILFKHLSYGGDIMKNLRIGKKLSVTFGVMIGLFCLTIAIAIMSLISIQQKFDDFYDEGYQITNRSMDLCRAIQSSAKNIGYAIMTPDHVEIEKYIKYAQDDSQILNDGTTFLRENYQGDMALVEKHSSLMDGIRQNRDKVYQLALETKNDEASSLYFSEVMPSLQEAQTNLMTINSIAQDIAENNFMASASQAQSTTVSLFLIALIEIIIIIFFAIYITRSLTKPIKEIEKATDNLANGILDKAIVAYQSKDELGNLANSIRTLSSNLIDIIGDESYLLGEMANGRFNVKTKVEQKYVGDFKNLLNSMRKISISLSYTLSQITQAADQVSSGSDQVSSGAQALSQGATEQASSVQELAATINEISQHVSKTAENSHLASRQSSETATELESGKTQMKNMTEAMNEINESSNAISKIIKTIEEISMQTNILALNATVEAARAGNAGKGFAVVAEEVRNLAAKSSEASKNTASLIEATIAAVQEGTNISIQTASSLDRIVESSKKSAALIYEISSAAQEQASSIVQVTEGIDQISEVVQTNSATAEESAAASEELSGQASMLNSLVSSFELRTDVPQIRVKQTV